MSLVEADEVPDARSFCSTSRTLSPRPAASRAMPTPLIPPPMIARSKSAMPLIPSRPNMTRRKLQAQAGMCMNARCSQPDGGRSNLRVRLAVSTLAKHGNAMSDPTASDHPVSDPATSEPAVSDPAAPDPAASDPVASEPTASTRIQEALAERFGEDFNVTEEFPGLDALARIAGHRSHRRFLPRPIEPDLLRLLCACALSAPSKSDLQQADIVIVRETAIRQTIVDTIPEMPWIMDAPAFLVFVGNGARLPMMSRRRDKPFPNDHLDAFFNAAVDGAIVMTTFIQAATSVGLGICPISAIRD